MILDILKGEASPLEGQRYGLGGCNSEVNRSYSSVIIAENFSERGKATALGFFLAHQNESACAIV